MKFVRKGSKYYHQLVISYLAIVVSISVSIGVISAQYFSSIYNRELIDVNQKMLSHLNTFIEESVLNRASELYESIAVENRDNIALRELFDVTLDGNHALIKPAFDYLQQIVGAAHRFIDSIHVYYKANNVVISSRNGIVYPIEDRFDMDNQWLQQFEDSRESEFWMPTRIIDRIEETKIVSFVKVLPAISNYDNYDGLICVNIKESAISDIISKQTNKNEDLVVFDSYGSLITESSIGADPYTDLSDVLNSKTPTGNTVQSMRGVASMVSYTTIEASGWRIVNYTPIRQFQKNLRTMQRVVFYICLISILVGFIVTMIFSAKMYNPLRSIVEKLGVPTKSRRNEYALIDTTLESLASKVNSLEQTLVENMPLIKRNVVMGLSRRTIVSSDELDKRLSMLNLVFDRPYFYSAVIDLRATFARPEFLGNDQYIKYNLINELENREYENTRILATEMSDHEIVIIANSRENRTEHQIETLKKIISGAFGREELFPVTIVGICVNDPMDVYTSYEIAREARKYMYVLFDRKFLDGASVLERDTSEHVLSDSMFNDFAKALKMQNIESATTCLNLITENMSNDNVSFDYCYGKTMEIVSIFVNYTKEVGVVADVTTSTSAHTEFQSIENLGRFREWMLGLVQETFAYLDTRSKNKNFVAIEDARKFIYDHIESDLYLENVAEQVMLKPHYFSKLFKDITGKSFVAFVNANKMVRAEELLLDSDFNIAEIAEKLRFSSAGYFIKKFKAYHGMTPSDYRNRKMRDLRAGA